MWKRLFVLCTCVLAGCAGREKNPVPFEADVAWGYSELPPSGAETEAVLDVVPRGSPVFEIVPVSAWTHGQRAVTWNAAVITHGEPENVLQASMKQVMRGSSKSKLLVTAWNGQEWPLRSMYWPAPDKIVYFDAPPMTRVAENRYLVRFTFWIDGDATDGTLRITGGPPTPGDDFQIRNAVLPLPTIPSGPKWGDQPDPPSP